jgi:phage I-like protein
VTTPIQAWALNGHGQKLISFAVPLGALAAGSNEGEMQIALSRSWKHGPKGEPITFDRAMFEAFIAEFSASASKEMPVDYDHRTWNKIQPDSRAAGWITSLFIRQGDAGPELWSKVRWTDDAANAIRAGEYRFSSPSFELEGLNDESGESRGPKLFNVALTNLPFQEGLHPILLSLAEATAGEPSNEPAPQPQAQPPADQGAPSSKLATFLDACVKASGLDRGAVEALLLDQADHIASLLAQIAERGRSPETTTMSTKTEDERATEAAAKAKEDEERANRTEMSVLRSQVQSMGTRLESVEKENATTKLSTVEAHVDQLIRTGFCYPDSEDPKGEKHRADAIHMFSTDPERAKRIYSRQLTPIGMQQSAIGDKGAKPIADISKATVADLTDDEKKTHMSIMNVGRGKYDADRVAQKIIGQRNASN